ncbi:MAG: GNAT family N-acetyltransferase [Nisaea sp.]|uniref:GNAT family N-acetyltransferase n=1 Tax=Nisaea sp. TaxID=2024842 RepID=UPI001B0B0C44|nr:GNAT family N-acetyltransferase [Nisaea sp.]MBO6560509.1 GNAT family N-acetyltransferase [Nisaea sp.]
MTAGGRFVLDEAITAHLDEAARLHGALFASPWSRAALQDLLAVPGTAGAAVLDVEGEPRFAGFVLFRSLGDFAEILTVAVAPEQRRHGHGRRLMLHAMYKARSAGAERMLLEVQDGNLPAIRLYEALGMTAFDRRPNYYKADNGSHADAIMMQLIFED